MRFERSYLKLALLAGGIVALAAVAGILTAQQGGGAVSASRSSYNTGPAGVQGFYELVSRTEQAPPLRLRSLSDLPTLRGVLIVAGPLERPLTQEEAGRVLTWVHGGNGLLYFVGRENLSRAPCALEDLLAGPQEASRAAGSPVGLENVEPAALSGSFPAFRVAATIFVDVPPREGWPKHLKGTALYRGPAGTDVAWTARGWGQIITCSTSTPIQNRHVASGHNLDFLLCALNVLRPAGGRIIFDELHHGHARPTSLLSLLSLEGVLVAMLQLGTCGLLYLLLQGRRMGPPVEERPTRQATVERYLEAAGQLYRRHCAPGEVVASYGAFVERELGRSSGARPPLAGWGSVEQDRVASLLRAAALAADSDMSPAQAAALIGKLDELTRSIRPERASGTVRPFLRERFHAPGSAADR